MNNLLCEILYVYRKEDVEGSSGGQESLSILSSCDILFYMLACVSFNSVLLIFTGTILDNESLFPMQQHILSRFRLGR